MSVLSLGLLMPLGAGAFSDRAVAVVEETAAGTPAKHVILTNGANSETVETRASTVDALLAERGIVRGPDDFLSAPPNAALNDGATITFRPAVDVNLVIDGQAHTEHTPAATVGQALAALHVAVGSHDTVSPAPETPLSSGATITLARVTSWLERVRTRIVPPVKHKYDIAMAPGTARVIDPGSAGTREATLMVLQPDAARAPKRLLLAERVLRLPRTKIVAEGIGDGVALSEIAHRGFVGTVRLADAALRMVATAYTADCSGCSGRTASGRLAGRGIVAVDPRVIPLGTRLFIPGYGHAYAGDTGGAIRGNRIDLGFDSTRDARTFGRRPIVVYVFK